MLSFPLILLLPLTPLVTALVLNYRTPQEAVRCVGALLKQSILRARPSPHGPFSLRGDGENKITNIPLAPQGEGLGERAEILVIDNHSQDDSIGVLRNRLKQFPNIHIIETPRNLGYGSGNMFALRFTHGKYILIINPDNELESDALKKMIEAMETDPSIGILGPKLVHEDGTIRDSYRSFPTITDIFIKRTMLRNFFPARMRQYLQWDEGTERPRDVDWLAGACLLIRRDLFRELGGFDPRFFMFFEDTDLCRRCRSIGKRVVYFPSAQATDRKHRLSAGGILSPLWKPTVRMHLVSAVKYFWKWSRFGGGFTGLLVYAFIGFQ